MAGVAVVTDSTASLNEEVAERAGIRVIPLQVVIDGVSRPEAATSTAADVVRPAVVAAALREGRRLTTSRPGIEEFGSAYADCASRGHQAVVSVHLSSAMSGTVEGATIAAAAAPLPVTVVDTQTIAMASGFAVLAAAAAATAGAEANAVADIARARAAASTTYFSVASLEYLRRGGRIGSAAALIGSALSVKPLLTVRGGSITVLERVRTASKALARLEELGLAALDAAAARERGVDLAVHHLAEPDRAEELAGRLRGHPAAVGAVVVAEMSAVLGAHVGPGTLGIVVAPQV